MDAQKLLEAIKKENGKAKDETVKELKGYIGEEIEKLATMTQRGFLEADGKMDKLDGKIDGLEGEMKKLHKRMNVLEDN
jgi:hypothetical protein